ncbi:uncharacterized protein LOC110992751 isoform X1 [Pieris rapae]|uniref:uncharacterized protein LOC110992751 isoform X1 n=2 Tax=Pieris rapae TaxID=64459 RepID=UPI001E281231|nr:uncharacterized protein LOC110992751 isoform X1 [Pieris rapae]
MYLMKNIVPMNSCIDLPTCMYNMRNPTQEVSKDDIDIKICDQVIQLVKNTSHTAMLDLEERQKQLLKKLDKLHEQINIIRSSCNFDNIKEDNSILVPKPIKEHLNEVVITINQDKLPWFLIPLLHENPGLKYTWHIHSSVLANRIHKIQAFFKNINLPPAGSNIPRVNLRIIFKKSTTELKISSLGLPIRGNVNILRYLCEQYPNTAVYSYNDYEMENLLDTCYLLENASETQKPILCKKLFPSSDIQWIYKNQFSIVDLALYNEIKQIQNHKKLVPQKWLSNCEKNIEK